MPAPQFSMPPWPYPCWYQHLGSSLLCLRPALRVSYINVTIRHLTYFTAQDIGNLGCPHLSMRAIWLRSFQKVVCMCDLATFSIYAEDVHSLSKLLALHDNVMKDLKKLQSINVHVSDASIVPTLASLSTFRMWKVSIWVWLLLKVSHEPVDSLRPVFSSSCNSCMHLSYCFVDCSLPLLDLFIKCLPDCSKAVLEPVKSGSTLVWCLVKSRWARWKGKGQRYGWRDEWI